jgi:hypothetical protein
MSAMEQRLQQALQAADGRPVDVAGRRTELLDTMGGVDRSRRRQRRLLAAAVVWLIVLAGLLVGQQLGTDRHHGVVGPSQRLPSGLPVGVLSRSVHLDSFASPGTSVLRLVVRPDGTGTFGLTSQDNLRLAYPVRFESAVRGVVTVVQADRRTCNGGSEVTMYFTVLPQGVRVDQMDSAGCSTNQADANALVGTVLRWYPLASAGPAQDP